MTKTEQKQNEQPKKIEKKKYLQLHFQSTMNSMHKIVRIYRKPRES